MALSQPGGRLGSDPDSNPGTEKRSRFGSSYQSGVQVSFGFGAGSMDEVAVSPKSPVHQGEEGVPNTEMGVKSVN